MCEWLSYSDWCDVLLICGGRSFNAHRVVLASVSNFLRRILLSCPVDESPVVIFLPEFDLDVMPAVLYYIYNGEVLLSNNKLKMFLDVANAMEIFIDQQSVLQEADYNRHCFEPSGEDTLSNHNYNIWQLKLCNVENEPLIKVKKGKESEEWRCHMQESVESLNLRDTSIQKFRRSEKKMSDLGDLTSVTVYQETQASLRDKFIERYSGEGSVARRTPSVLAISNKEHRVPSSVLKSNTYKDHPSAYEIYTNTSKRPVATNSSDTSIYNYLKQMEDHDYRDNGKGNINISYTVCNQLINKLNAESTLQNISKREQLIDFRKSYIPLQTSLPSWLKDSSPMFTLGEHSSFLNFGHIKVTPHFKFRAEVPKVTIMNEVLQSPWHPRQPNNYKPFHKEDSVHFKNHPENKASVSSIDNNNNCRTQLKMNVSVHDTLISSELHDLRCIVCQEVFTGRQDLSTHMRRHSSITRYSCEECEKTFSQLRNFKYHMSVHRGTKEFAATCSVCGKHFNDRGYLSNHMKIHRNRKEYKCASCPKSFNQRVAFNMHVRIHTGVKPHVCEECGKAFSRKMLLKQHQRTHTGERPYACAHCDKRFADRSNMTLHLRLHTGVKPFSCTLCSKSFTKKHHLKSHLNFHTGAKPYSCPRCKLTFTQSSNMRTHLKKCNAN